jgi:micrococcal nuclease
VRFTSAATAFLALCVPALADNLHYEFGCRVVAIADGDTLTIRDEDGAQHTIHLRGIDAPELGQKFGTKSREALAGKVLGRTVRVEVDVRHYPRLEGKVYLGDRFINAEMVRDGFAWRDDWHGTPGEFKAAEAEARKHRRGLWADKDPMPPWEWRQMMAAHADSLE